MAGIALVLLPLLVACSDDPVSNDDGVPPPPVIPPFFTVESEIYEAQAIEENGDTVLTVTIPMLYENRYDVPAYFRFCRQPPYDREPLLEAWESGRWIGVHGKLHAICANRNIRRVEPGETFAYDYEVNANGPNWWNRDQVDGWYRVNWVEIVSKDSVNLDDEDDAVPLPERVSNTFWLSGTLPWAQD